MSRWSSATSRSLLTGRLLMSRAAAAAWRATRPSLRPPSHTHESRMTSRPAARVGLRTSASPGASSPSRRPLGGALPYLPLDQPLGVSGGEHDARLPVADYDQSPVTVQNAAAR